MAELIIPNNYYIKSQRLYLREFDVNDINQIYLSALNNHEIVGLTEARHKKWTKASTLKYIKDIKESRNATLVGIFQINNDSPIGNIRLFNIHPIHKRAELGIMLYDKSKWGKGYGSEALKALCEFAFNTIGLKRIHADYYRENIPSSKIFSKVGFKVEGVFKSHFFYNGNFTDSIRVGLINNKLA